MVFLKEWGSTEVIKKAKMLEFDVGGDWFMCLSPCRDHYKEGVPPIHLTEV